MSSVPLVDPLTLADAGTAALEELTRIGTNNRLRRFLRTTVARFALASDDPAVRLGAVNDMVRSLDAATVELLAQRAADGNRPRREARIELASRLRRSTATIPRPACAPSRPCRIG